MTIELISIKPERIFLDVENPRFPEGKCESESDAISLLTKDEFILGLARDIVEIGLNPLESLGVIKDQKPTRNFSDQTYIVIEGNRRLCALKLLSDPELASSEQKKTYIQLSKKWRTIKNVKCTVFKDRDDAKIWLERLHGDLNGGIGRKKWTAEVKQRFSGDKRNQRAQEVLDYAQDMNMITEKQRKERLTTATRFLNNVILREALGLDKNVPSSGLTINRPKEDFDLRLERFITDLIANDKVNSRADSKEVVNYARELTKDVSVSESRIDSEPLIETELQKMGNSSRNSNRKPKKAPKLQNIQHNKEISTLLRQIKNTKLESFYFGLCRISLEDHYVPLLTIGAWAFIESLSAADGRKSGTSFKSYYSKSKLASLELEEKRAISGALKRLEEVGNTTKHHFVSAQFHGQQLANDMQCLETLIIATCYKIIKSNLENSSGRRKTIML